MGRLKFKPNLGATRGSTGGSGASVDGGKVRAVAGRGQRREMRQSGDESTGGESVGEVETGEPFAVEKSKESKGGHLSGSEQTVAVGGSRTEKQDGPDDESTATETDVQVDTLLTSDGGSRTHRGVQTIPASRWARKKVAPKITSGRPKRLGRKEKGLRVEELNQRSSDTRETARGSCSEAEETSVTTLAGHSSAEDRDGTKMDDTERSTDGAPHHEVAGDFNTVPSSLNPGQRSTSSVLRTRTCSAASTDMTVVSDSAHGPSSQDTRSVVSGHECTDEAISNTLIEVLQGVHTTAQMAPNDADLSGIVRSSLDLLCPPPPLSQVGDDTLIPDHSRPGTVMQESCSNNENRGGEVLPSNSQSQPSTSALSESRASSKNSTGGHPRTDSGDGVSDGEGGEADPGGQLASSAPSRAQEGVSKGGRKRRRRKSGTKRKRSSTSAVDDDDPTTASLSSSQPKKPRINSGKAIKKVREAPDRSTMTMRDLIYYNPTANPMSSTVEEIKQTKEEGDREQQVKGRGQSEEGRASTQTQPKSPTRQQENGEREEEEKEEEEEEEEGRIVPQLRIGKDGNIVLDEQSMVVETTWKSLSEEASDLVFESSGHTTSASFRKSYRVNKWTREETSKFYKALSQVGTDFTMMTLLMPRRSRKELKNKFKKEEKNNPHLISQALKNQLSLQKLCQE